jgi:putative tryptophan/tyrosine transport system substrate-binding protein
MGRLRISGPTMRRREFITLIGGAAAAWPFATRAQKLSAKVFRIGFLGSPTADSLPKRPEAFRAGLRDLGYQEGQDFVIEYRWAGGNYDRLPALFADLVRLKVDVIVTHGTPAALAAKTATTIPVVFAVVGDALGSGIVSSLARPGGNVTGLTFFAPELNAKRLELLKEALPGLTDVGILLNLVNPMNEPILAHMSRVAQPLKLELHQLDVRAPTDFEGAFAAMAAQRAGALVVIDDVVLLANAPAVAALALKQRLPSCGLARFRHRWWLDGLWGGHCRHVPARGHVRRQDSERRKAERPAGRAGDQVRDYCQSKDRQRARPYNSVQFARPRRRGDRMIAQMSAIGP